jgi:hypothetical protein
MSRIYDNYLIIHKKNVSLCYEWLKTNLTDLITASNNVSELDWQLCFNHDHSKNNKDEYNAYDAYFYGGNKSYSVVQEFNKAWLLHIHRNPHHWQHWVLINDDPNTGIILIEMPYNYIIEMICDWWSFGWYNGNLNDIFTWYNEHKEHIQLHNDTRKTVESILAAIKSKLEEGK